MLRALVLVPALAVAMGASSMPDGAALSNSDDPRVTGVCDEAELSPSDVIGYKVMDIKDNADKTSVIVEFTRFRGEAVSVYGATLKLAGRTVDAESVQSEMIGRNGRITIGFPPASGEQCSAIVMNINGHDVMLDLRNMEHNADIALVPIEECSLSDCGLSQSSDEGVDIYYDGQKITDAQLKVIPPSDIASISVDKLCRNIYITSKLALQVEQGAKDCSLLIGNITGSEKESSSSGLCYQGDNVSK